MDPEEVRRVTEAVLEQADYDVSDGPTLLDSLVNAVLEQLGRLLLRVDGDGGTGSVVAALALVAVVVALVVALAVLLRRLRRSGRVQTVVQGPVGRAHTSWAAQAQQAEAAGDLREALRCRWHETIALLAEAGLVREVPGRTTGEYLRAAVVSLPAASVPLTAMTQRFEAVWYGGEAVDADALAAIRADQARVVAAVPRSTRGPAVEVGA